MSGVYAHNKLFDTNYQRGAEDLPNLEDDVFTDDSVATTVFENYETSIEEEWPEFIKDFYN